MKRNYFSVRTFWKDGTEPVDILYMCTYARDAKQARKLVSKKAGKWYPSCLIGTGCIYKRKGNGEVLLPKENKLHKIKVKDL